MAERNLNIDWKQYYKDHLCSMEEAAKAVKPGDCIWVGEASSIPYTFLDELYKHKEDYHDVTIYSNVFNQPADMIFDPEAKKYFRQITSYNLPLERMSIGMNVMECGSIGYDKLGDAPFVYGCNAGATYINPPDENGWCNVGVYGVSTNIINYNNPRIKKVFGFIDATGQPPVRGDNLEWTSIHVTQLDYIVEQSTEIMEIPSAPPTQVDKDIASYILPLLKSGDKVEIGFGGLGEEIMANLKSRAPLEVITEVACDNMMNLVEEGILTKVIACSPGAWPLHTLSSFIESRLSRLISGVPGSSSSASACRRPSALGRPMTARPRPPATPAHWPADLTRSRSVQVSGPQHSYAWPMVLSSCRQVTTARATSRTHTG